LNRARVKIQDAIYTEDLPEKIKKATSDEERSKLVDKFSEYIAQAIKYIDAGSDVVMKARDFAKPTKGLLAPVDLRMSVDKAIFMVKELKFKAGLSIPINTEIANDVPKVKVKEDDLREVVITVLDNAVDAIRMKRFKKEGEASSDSITVKAAYLKNMKLVELRIIDTGLGIKPEDLKNIFLRYFTTKPSADLYEDYAKRKDVRVKTEKDDAVYGTGLGLDLVKSLVEEQIKGTIRVESEYGHGATFIITIPEWVEEKNDKDTGSRG
jgi:signal transduction histidine kinase